MNFLAICVTSMNQLQPHLTFPEDSQSKIIYIVKKKPEIVTDDNLNEIITIGEVSTKLVAELDVLIGDVFIPLIQNQWNRQNVPNVMSEDIEKHMCDFYSNLVQFKGVLLNETVLPLPNCVSEIGDAIEKFEDS